MSRMARRPRWQRMLLPVVIFAVTGALLVTGAQKVISAERVSITVDRCGDYDGVTKSQDCRGTWHLADGTAVTGPVGGGARNWQGEEVAGWGNRSSATVSLLNWLLVPVVSGLIFLAGLAGLGVSGWLALKRTRATSAQPRRP